MTHTLALLRHAKSAYPPGVDDHDRPLSERGMRDAPVAGRVLSSRVGRPDLVLVSSARRAQQTWDLAARAWPVAPDSKTVPGIYDASLEQVLAAVQQAPEFISTLVVVGHVPGVSDLALALSQSSGDDALTRMQHKFPTSGLACLTVDLPWERLHVGGGHLDTFDIPRGLKND